MQDIGIAYLAVAMFAIAFVEFSGPALFIEL